jgi:hypothetical protein
MQCSVEAAIEVEESPALQSSTKVRVVAWHRKLHISPRFVQKVSKRGAWYDIGTFWTALLDCCVNSGNRAVSLETLLEVVSKIST